jgi:hypothetical protein
MVGRHRRIKAEILFAYKREGREATQVARRARRSRPKVPLNLFNYQLNEADCVGEGPQVLSLPDTEHAGRQALPGQVADRAKGLGEARAVDPSLAPSMRNFISLPTRLRAATIVSRMRRSTRLRRDSAHSAQSAKRVSTDCLERSQRRPYHPNRQTETFALQAQRNRRGRFSPAPSFRSDSPSPGNVAQSFAGQVKKRGLSL